MRLWILGSSVILGIFCLWYLVGSTGLRATRQAAADCATVEAQIQKTKLDIEMLRQNIDSWQQNPFQIEKYARERLALCKKDERVLLF